MSKVNHKNIIKYWTSFFVKDALYIVMEYAEGGDMHDVFTNFYKFNYIVNYEI